MSHRFVAFAVVVTAVVAAVSLAPVSIAGQLDGQPNLEGIWTNATITPLERPQEFAGKEFLTEKEAAEYEKQVAERTNAERRDANAEADLAVGYNDVWWDRGTRVVSTRRTSIIVDPPDGRSSSVNARSAEKSGCSCRSEAVASGRRSGGSIVGRPLYRAR